MDYKSDFKVLRLFISSYIDQKKGARELLTALDIAFLKNLSESIDSIEKKHEK